MATISIFDTTLRDGEQSPGASMTASEKLRMAHQLEALGVDILEAGFAAASPDEIDAIAAIAHAVRAPTIAALARATEGDVEAAARAVQGARHPRIHVFIATSDIHLERKLGIDRDACVEQAAAAVRHARRYADDVEFSAEDATRTDVDFLCRVVAAAVSEGSERCSSTSAARSPASKDVSSAHTATTTSGTPWRTRSPPSSAGRRRSSAP
jgi:2-isopropylmalate synthase